MKKILFALMAVCAITFSFTSCDNMADPSKEPVAGHQYYDEDEGGYSELQFHMDHSLTLYVRAADGTTNSNDLYVWSMNKNNVLVKGAPGTKFAGKEFVSGVFDTEKHTITGTVTNMVTGDKVPAVFKEKGYTVD